MASLSELMQAATLTQQAETQSSRSGQIASFLNKALSGYTSGRELARKDKADKLDQFIKGLDIRKKEEDLQKSAAEGRITRNLYKRMGLLDLDPGEVDAARPAALDAITHKTPPRENSTSGKLASIYVGDNEFAALPDVPGIQWKEIKKDDKDKDPVTRNNRIREQAIDAARREKFNTMVQLAGPDEAAKFADAQPTEDEVQKFIPEITAYFEGKNDDGTKIRKSRQGRDSFVNEAVKNIQQQITHLNDNPEQLEKLTQRKNRLLVGGGVDELLNQMQEDLMDLQAKDPKKNADAIDELGEKIIKLRRARR